MGYRIGYQCFVSNEAAHDYLLSQQPPTITAEGLLIRPVKQGQDWYLNGQKIQLSFPECSLQEQIQLGAELARPHYRHRIPDIPVQAGIQPNPQHERTRRETL